MIISHAAGHSGAMPVPMPKNNNQETAMGDARNPFFQHCERMLLSRGPDLVFTVTSDVSLILLIML